MVLALPWQRWESPSRKWAGILLELSESTYYVFVLERNLCFDVNTTLVTSCLVTLQFKI